MADLPPSPPSAPPPPGGKRPAIGLQLKLASPGLAEVKARYGEELKHNRFFVRTKAPRPKDTLVRLEALLADGSPCFRAAAVVVRAQEPGPAGSPDAGMALQLLAVDEAGRDLIAAVGGKPPPPLKAEARPGARPLASDPSLAPVPPRPSDPKLAPFDATVSDPRLSTVARPSDPKLAKVPPARASDPKLAKVPPKPSPLVAGEAARGEAKAAPLATPALGAPEAEAVPAPPAAPVAASGSASASASGSASAPGSASASVSGSASASAPASAAAPPSAPAPSTGSGAAPAAPAEPFDPFSMPDEPPVAAPPKPAPAPPPVMSAGPAAPAAPVADPNAPPQPGGPAPSRKGPVIGIDLGTTNSCAAVVEKGKPKVIPSREGYNTIPSIVALNDKGKLIIGHPAKGQMLTNPRNTVYGAKRLVGRAFASQVVNELAGRFQYEIVAGPRGEAAVQLGEQQLSLQQISSMVLREVKEIAQQYLQSEVSRAVITVPAYYNDNQRHAVREAGLLAGLHVERILNEPTAAALAFAHGKTYQQHRVLVYDLGGGTFDASVLELHGNVYEVVSTGGDTFLGGVDFDKVLVDHLLAGFKELHKIDFPGDRVALQRVTDAAERAKIGLSEQLEYRVRVPFVAMVGEKPYDLETTLARSELVLLTGHLVDRTLKVCEEVLAARKLTPKDIDEVLLVGGQSRMPLVRERIRGFFGREPSKAVHPDEAVALGAALLAEQMQSGDIGGVVLVDVLPMSIGVGLPGGRFKKIIERNTSLPHQRTHTISTTKDDQPALELAVFQGESEKAQENEYLGTLVVKGLPRGAKGTVSFDIEFQLSPECLLTVIALERGTGRTVIATFTTQDTPEAVRKKLAEDGTGAPPEPAPAAKAGVGGWFKRLFGK